MAVPGASLPPFLLLSAAGGLGEVELVDVTPPLGDGRPGGEREKVGDDGLLRQRGAAVPEDGDQDVATQAQHGAVVVREEI
jgi:hypothetical protein